MWKEKGFAGETTYRTSGSLAKSEAAAVSDAIDDLARRIVDYVEPGQKVKQGDVIGLIKLGSQVTVILPHNVKIDTKLGETVIDGESVLGEIEK